MSRKPTVKIQDAISVLIDELDDTKKWQNKTNQNISDLNKGIQDILKYKIKIDDTDLKASNAELLSQQKAIVARTENTFNQKMKQLNEIFEHRSQQIKEQIEIKKENKSKKDNLINYTIIVTSICFICFGLVINRQSKLMNYEREVNNLNTENSLYRQYLVDSKQEESFMHYINKD